MSTATSRSTQLGVEPLAGAIGAIVTGIDLADLDDATVEHVRAIWLERLVVFFRDQELDDEAFLAFARRIGEPVRYPFVKGFDTHPEIIEVAKLPHETVNFGGIWHSDTVYLEQPPMATMLLARELPPYGGDTMFASMYAAYDALSPALREMLDGLQAVNSSALADVSKTREDRIRDHGSKEEEQQFLATHPVVRTHPETGRKALYVNRAHTASFAGMTEEESAPAPRVPVPPLHPARVHVPVPMGAGFARLVGQPRRDAQSHQRLPRFHPPDAPDHARRRHPRVTERA